jgi:hypothetical protein
MDNDGATFCIGEGIGPAVAFLSPPLPALPPREGLPRSKPPGKSATLWAGSNKTRATSFGPELRARITFWARPGEG